MMWTVTKETAAERLNRLMNERRVELGLQWQTVAALANITTSTLGAVRRGDNEPTELTMRGLETALRWKRGSVAKIYAFQDPEPLEPSGASVTSSAEEDLRIALENLRKIEEKLIRKRGPRTSRQVRELQRLVLAVDGVNDAFQEDPEG